MGTAAESNQALDQVREILFGAIQHELERRLARTEAHFATRLSEVQQEARRRTEVIEAHLRRETEALSTRIEREIVEIRDQLRGLARDQREKVVAMEERLAKGEEALARSQQEHRQQILDQTKEFLDEMQKLRTELAEMLERELASLEIVTGEEEQGDREPRAAAEGAAS
jgi:hypothetical protein